MMTPVESQRLESQINAAFEKDRKRIAALEQQVTEMAQQIENMKSGDKPAPKRGPGRPKAA